MVYMQYTTYLIQDIVKCFLKVFEPSNKLLIQLKQQNHNFIHNWTRPVKLIMDGATFIYVVHFLSVVQTTKQKFLSVGAFQVKLLLL